MLNLIAACTKNNGIGYNGTIPWSDKEEFKHFKKLTMNNVLIVGRKTLDTLPYLPSRHVFYISRTRAFADIAMINNARYCSSLEDAVKKACEEFPDNDIFIAGGGEIYKEALSDSFVHRLDTVHLSVMNCDVKCDTFIPIHKEYFVCMYKEVYETFTYYKLKFDMEDERNYLLLLKNILCKSSTRMTRNGLTKSIFNYDLSFNLENGFPLLTTKKMFFRGIVEELLFFLRGQTDSNILSEKGVNIWKGNTSREFLDNMGMTGRKVGVMGPIYGYNFRHFGAEYDEKTAGPKQTNSRQKGFDQLQYVIDTIRNDPTSRRILMTSFNPAQASEAVLYPCHSLIIQFYVEDVYLDMFCYNRSQDVFLGVPFNIASSALLLKIVAKCTSKTPRWMHMSMGDAHIYLQHFEKCELQMERLRYTFPSLSIKKEIRSVTDIENLEYSDFVLEDYRHHPAIKAKMVA